MKHFWVFCSTCYILKDREDLKKIVERSDFGIFLDYVLNNWAYKVYNLKTSTIMKFMYVVVDDSSIDIANDFG